MTSLVDRYVYTALRRVPQQQRSDIDRELRASIEDAIDARVEDGTPRDTAIESTLTELGDPDKLADSYANRPDYLISPELYGVWRRLMIMMFSTVLPIVLAVTVVIQLFDDPTFGKVIGTVIGTGLTVGVHLAFWTTLAIFIVDRTGAGKDDLKTTWTLKDLPKYEPRAMPKSDLATWLAWPAVLIAALVLQQFTFTDVPVLDPANWSFWWPFLIVAFALRGAAAVWVYRHGWNRLSTTITAAVVLLAAVPMIWLLAADQVLNPAFPQFTGPNDPRSWITAIAIGAVALSAAWDIFDVTRRGERARRGLPSKVMGTGNTYTFN
jgi:hypothetical protein